MTEFSDIASALSSTLQDDPARGAPQHDSPVNTPLPELDGELEPILTEGDNLVPGGLAGVLDENAIAARDVLPDLGIEALAFYKSFRFINRSPFRGRWGIFLVDAGIEAVSAEFEAQRPALSAFERRMLATRTLLEHERYHFWVDAWALASEVSSVSTPLKRYEYYLQSQRPFHLTASDHEESLANYYAFRKLRRLGLSDGRTFSPLLRNLFQNCPVPYSLFEMPDDSRDIKERLLAGAVANGLSIAGALLTSTDERSRHVGKIIARSIRPMPNAYPLTERRSCPVYLLRLRNYAALVKPFEGPKHAEFKRFVTDYLDGRFTRRTDHEYYRIDNGEELKIPNNHDKTVRGYELKNVLLKAGLRPLEFWKARMKTKGWKVDCPRQPVQRPFVD